ncbi:hypothetical protein K488DRAFT_75644 [Vararia minispora EC-137]|uniref:Uncharacterized protein n=1 Tax=Vararia minispora EC-137 TaxID=1314806 RepID=A0ACB8QY93_9AGAM|nr:hypothetical protein K488DRAFT_75644 [Vararia minispora EC-137]
MAAILARNENQIPVIDGKAEYNTPHPMGFTAAVFSRDGSYCYTAGDDCLARIWIMSEGDDQEPTPITEAGGSITTVASGVGDVWFTGSEDGEVRQYKGETFESMVTSVAGVAIRSLAVDPAGKRIAVSSDELTAKIIDLSETTKVWLLDGYKECVRKVTWDPSGSLLATSTADGKVVIWDVTQEDPRQVKTIEGVIDAVKDSKTREFQHDCSAVWHPSGQYFVLPTRTHEIAAFSRDTWTETGRWKDSTLTGAVTTLAISPNGAYLASCYNSLKEIQIWSTESKKLLLKLTERDIIFSTQLSWSPTENVLASGDYGGGYYRWRKVIPEYLPPPTRPMSISSTTPAAPRRETRSLFDQAEPVGNDRAVYADGDIDLDNLEELDPIDWIEDDLGMDRSINAEMTVSVTKAQPPFQPGATPMEHKKRYLAYNMIGVIEVTDQDTHNIVNVEFHDRSARKAYHFNDNYKYGFAALGERGAAYACQPESGHPGHVHYKPYGTWASQGEWTYELDENVKVLGVAAGGTPPAKSYRVTKNVDAQGNGNVVVATSDNELTFLTGTGIERCSVALDGDFVSMVAGPEWVFVVQRDGATTMDGSQNLMGTLYDFEDLCVLQTRKLPVRKGQTLKWIGVSEDGAPAVYDSAGVMYLMPRYRIPLRGTWVRVLDTNKLERKKGKDESYWPVGLTGENLHCLILKGRQEHPAFPRPLIQELELRLPFRRKDPKEGPLEEHLARETMHIQMKLDALGDDEPEDDIRRRELALDKELIQLIQNACKNDKLPRALDLTRLLHHVPSYDLAMKVADFYHLRGLREKMQLLKDEFEEHDRAENGRQKRRRWASDYEPVAAPRTGPSDDAHPRAFQDFGPPPAVYRPGLARATPNYFGNGSASSSTVATAAADFPMDTDLAGPSDAAKRKRAGDDVAYRDRNPTSPVGEGAKRRALDGSSTDFLPPPKAGGNPFANRSATAQARNPFNRPLHKSETFFNKVEVAESSSRANGKGKGVVKKDTGPRQTTLFGLPAVPPADKFEKRGRSKKSAAGERASGSPAVESQAEDSQQTEVEESQEAEVEKTQEMEIARQTRTEAVEVEDVTSPEPIEWLASPPPASGTLPEVEATA